MVYNGREAVVGRERAKWQKSEAGLLHCIHPPEAASGEGMYAAHFSFSFYIVQDTS